MDATDTLTKPDTKPRQADVPLVSVVIPTYGCSLLIVETLDSVFAQTWPSLEVIVVNDGSPDTTALEEALKPYQSRIVYLRQENRGPSAARNVGIQKAQGRYIAFLDCDDTWLSEHIAQQMEHFTNDPSLSLMYSNNLLLRDGRVLGQGFDAVPQAGDVNLDSLLSEDCTVNTSSVVALREAILQCGGFDQTMSRCEDFDLWLRMSASGARMAYDRRVQVRHRAGQGLSSNAEGMKRGRLRAYENIVTFTQLTAAQQTIVDRKRRELEAGIRIEVAKQRLEDGRFDEARSAMEQALKLSPTLKLRLGALGMRVAPRFSRHAYHAYLLILGLSGRGSAAQPAATGQAGRTVEP